MDGNKALKNIVKAASIVFIGLVLSKLLSYFYRVLIARYLGPESYGVLSLGVALLGFATFFSIFGLDAGVIRYVSYFLGKKDFGKVKSIILNSLKIVFVLSTLCMLLFILFSDYLAVYVFKNPDLSIVVKLLAVSIPFSSVSLVFYSIFRAFNKIQYEVYSKQLLENIFKVIFTCIFLFIGFELLGAIFIYVMSIIVSFILSLFLFKKVYGSLNVKESYFNVKELLTYSFPLMFTGFFWMIMQWTDTLMIGKFLNLSDVGIYNVALPLADLVFVVHMGIFSIFLPTITYMSASGKKKELVSLFKTTSRWVFYFNLPICLFMILFSKDIIFIFFGNDYVSGYSSLIVLLFGALMFSLMRNSVEILKMVKKTKLILYITCVSGVMNFVLNLLFIPRFGIIGAAISTSFSWILYSGLLSFVAYKNTGMTPFSKSLLNATIPSLISVYFIDLWSTLFNFSLIVNLVFNAVIFMVVYFSFLILFGGLKKEDFIVINAIKSKLKF